MRIWILTGWAASFFRFTEAEVAGADTSMRMGKTEMFAACAICEKSRHARQARKLVVVFISGS
jgi:hypothetical protein